MILDSEQLIDQILKELKIIQAELDIQRAMLHKEYPQPKNIVEFMEMSKQQFDDDQAFKKAVHYLNGKFDAYVNMLNVLGLKYDRNETK